MDLFKTAFCQECETPLYHKDRTDKKFCNLKCKNSFHNRIQCEKRRIRREIDSALHRNHDLLMEYDGQKQVSLIELKAKGFDNFTFNRLTKDEDQKTWQVCYNYAFRETIFNHQPFILILKLSA